MSESMIVDKTAEVQRECNAYHRRSTMETLMDREKEIEELRERVSEKEAIIKNQLEEIKALEFKVAGRPDAEAQKKLANREWMLDIIQSICSRRDML